MKLRGLGADVNTIYLTIGKSFPYVPSANEARQATEIIALYNSILGRDPMPVAGQPDVWYKQYSEGVISLEAIGKYFLASDEWKYKHGGTVPKKDTAKDIVRDIKKDVGTQYPATDYTPYYIGGGILAVLFFFRKKLGKILGR